MCTQYIQSRRLISQDCRTSMDSVTLKAAHEFSLLKIIVIIGKHFNPSDFEKIPHAQMLYHRRGRLFWKYLLLMYFRMSSSLSATTRNTWNTWEFMFPAAEVGSLSGTAKNHTKSFGERRFTINCNKKGVFVNFSRQKRRISMMLSVKISLEE